MVQTSSPNSNMEHQSQTLLYRSSCTSTAFQSIKKKLKCTGIPRTVRHLLPSMLACLCLQKPERGSSLTCFMRSAQLGEAVVTQYVEDGVGCPPVLRKNLFTTAAVDNIDHNPSATTAQTSFHGTSISIFRHPSTENAGEEREVPKVKSDVKVKKVPELPEAFTNVLPAYITKNPNPPPAAYNSLPVCKI